MKQPKGIYLNGVSYAANSRCPACSSERDAGGRLEWKKRTNYYLVCMKCRYSVHGKRATDKQERFHKKRNDRALGLK